MEDAFVFAVCNVDSHLGASIQESSSPPPAPSYFTLFLLSKKKKKKKKVQHQLTEIQVRIIFRMIEFMGGDEPEENPLPFNEIYGYVLDATPMMVGLTIAAVVHPGRVLQGPNSEFPHKSRSQKRAEKKARKQAKEEKKRGKEFERSQNMGMGMSYELPHGYIKTAVGDGSRNR